LILRDKGIDIFDDTRGPDGFKTSQLHSI